MTQDEISYQLDLCLKTAIWATYEAVGKGLATSTAPRKSARKTYRLTSTGEEMVQSQ